MGIWSGMLSWLELAEDSLEEPVHVNDLLTPAIWEYDERGLRFHKWKDYKIDPTHHYRVLKLQGFPILGGCQAYLKDVSCNCDDTPLVPTDLFEKAAQT